MITLKIKILATGYGKFCFSYRQLADFSLYLLAHLKLLFLCFARL